MNTAQVLPFNQTTTEYTEVGLASKALLVSLTIRMPPTTKKDQEASEETAASHQANEKAVSVNKRLWPKDAMQLFSKPASLARKVFAEQTLPWGNGNRILAAVGYERFLSTMKIHEEAFWKGVDKFMEHVETYRSQARTDAGTLFREEDYSTLPEELRTKFDFELSFLPVPTQGDFRVTLSSMEQDRIKEQLSNSLQKSYSTAVKTSWERVYGVTKLMAERLQAFESGDTKIIRSAIVDNISELCDTLPALNLSGDPELIRMVDEVRTKLTGNTAQQLKVDGAALKQTRLDADAIARKVDQYLGLLG